MGNPAGLKLNKPLNTTVGNFFLYHIYLWRSKLNVYQNKVFLFFIRFIKLAFLNLAYITFLKPALLYSLKVLRWSSLLGFTLTLALIDDIFSLLTIHVFCFYVYAARFDSF